MATTDYRLIPRSATATTIDVWVGAFADELDGAPELANVHLRVEGQKIDIDWRQVDGCPSFRHALIQLASSVPKRVELVANDKPPQWLDVAPLPAQLDENRPFRVVLGSCFEPSNFNFNRLARAVRRAAAQHPIQLKLLCGDQVYLDPVIPPPPSRSEADHALQIYRDTWGDANFGELLRAGANVFCGDDHELWNDYTVEQGPKEPERERVARALFGAFQGGFGLQTLRVGELRILVADTRFNRTDHKNPDGPRFIDDDSLAKIVEWLGEKGPSVLVLGQPLFGEVDYDHEYGSDIPQYRRQFATLARAILESPSSVVVMSGDLHFGRVAHKTKPGGKQLLEIISSPLGLTRARRTAGIKRPWKKALGTFPGDDLPHEDFPYPRATIETCEEYKIASPHFVTIDFFAERDAPDGVKMCVRTWPLAPIARVRFPNGHIVIEREL